MILYKKKLGFTNTFKWGNPTTYPVIKQGGVQIHLTLIEHGFIPSKNHCAIYIFVHDLHLTYQKCIEEEISIISSLEDRDYEMKDFDIKDPDGFIITFGNGQ